MKPPRPPWKVAVYALLITLAVGIVVAGVLAIVNPPHDGSSPFEQGKRFGDGLGKVAIVIAAIAYIVAWRRQQKRNDP